MNSYRRRIVLILFALVFFTTTAFALPLGSVTLSHSNPNYGPDHFSDSSMLFITSLFNGDVWEGYKRDFGGGCNGGNFFGWNSLNTLFRKNLTLNDIGYTFAINQGNCSGWDHMIQFVLLDGYSNIISYTLEDREFYKLLEWDFSEHYAGNGINFQGYYISNLLLTIDSLKVIHVVESYPGLPDYYNKDYYNWTLTWTLTVDGHHLPVPEPGTLLLLGSGLAGLAVYRRRMNKA